MAGNARTAIVGVAFALLAIAGYQYIYKVGIWKPNISTKSAIDEALGRADRVTAAEARKDLDALLSRAEKGERLDRSELERLIKAAATDAGNLDALWKEAETKSRGVVVAPPPSVQPQPQPPSQPARESAVTPAPPPPVARIKPSPASDQYFFDDDITLQNAHSGWTRVESPSSLKKFALVVNGATELQEESRNQMTRVGPRGIEPTYVRFVNSEQTISSSSMFLALLSRLCSSSGCGDVKQFRQNPWMVCLEPDEWLELRLNVQKGGMFERNTRGLTVRAERSAAFCGGL